MKTQRITDFFLLREALRPPSKQVFHAILCQATSSNRISQSALWDRSPKAKKWVALVDLGPDLVRPVSEHAACVRPPGELCVVAD